jgi:hypothetical protein
VGPVLAVRGERRNVLTQCRARLSVIAKC